MWPLHRKHIAGLCQALNDILDSMSSKGVAIPVIGILPIRYYMQSLDKSYLQLWLHVIVVGAGGRWSSSSGWRLAWRVSNEQQHEKEGKVAAPAAGGQQGVSSASSCRRVRE